MTNTETLNPQVKLFLDQFNEFMKTQPKEIPVEQGRMAYENFAMMHAGVPLKMARVEDLEVPSADGKFQIPIRIYTPKLGVELPALVYFHGGGWQRGSINSHDSICRNLAIKANCIVVSVEWRLAPEHKFPIGANDCWDAYHWFVKNAKTYNADANRIAMGGDSAGGNMTGSNLLRLKEEGKKMPVFAILFYPSLDLSCTFPSYVKYEDGYFLGSDRVRYYVNHYINDPKDIENPRVSPLKAKDLSGFPPTHIVNAGFDPLRDEGLAFAEKLKSFGVPATHKVCDGMIHAFLHMTATVPEVNTIFDDIAVELKKGLAERQ